MVIPAAAHSAQHVEPCEVGHAPIEQNDVSDAAAIEIGEHIVGRWQSS